MFAAKQHHLLDSIKIPSEIRLCRPVLSEIQESSESGAEKPCAIQSSHFRLEL